MRKRRGQRSTEESLELARISEDSAASFPLLHPPHSDFAAFRGPLWVCRLSEIAEKIRSELPLSITWYVLKQTL